MHSTYIRLDEQENKYGTVVLDAEAYTFYLFLKEEYQPTKEQLSIGFVDMNQKRLYVHGVFDHYTLTSHDGEVFQEGYAILLYGYSHNEKVVEFDAVGKIDWEPYVAELSKKIDFNYTEDYEKIIAVFTESDDNQFEKNYAFFSNSIEVSVFFRKKRFNRTTGESKYLYYEYKENDIDPEKEFDIDDIIYRSDSEEGEGVHLIPYEAETWKELIRLVNSGYNPLNGIDALVDGKKL